MARGSEKPPAHEISPTENLYNVCCDSLLKPRPATGPNDPPKSKYVGDQHRLTGKLMLVDGKQIRFSLSDYFASSTIHWDLGSNEYGADEAQQRDLLERRQTILSVKFYEDNEAQQEQAAYLLFRPADINSETTLGVAILYGFTDEQGNVSPAIEPSTYDPAEVLAIIRTPEDPLSDVAPYALADLQSDQLLPKLLRQIDP